MIYATLNKPLTEWLQQVTPETERMVLCGPYPDNPAELRAWLSAVPEGWTARVSRARASGVCEAAVFAPSGQRVRITSAAAWFGRVAMSPAETVRRFQRLQWHLMREFGLERPVPLISPAVTGTTLWRQEAEDTYSPLDEATQTLIRATCGQGRSEVFSWPGRTVIERFEYWDMRLAYPSLCENLPVGPVVRDEVPELPAGKGRVRVQFWAPPDWAHVGVLPVKSPYGPLAYPLLGEGWVDAMEARYAEQQGWTVLVKERLLFAEGRPLNTWSRRLLRLYLRLEAMGEAELARACRAIVIQTIGDMHGRGRTGAGLVRQIGREEPVEREVTLPRRAERVSHPEWSAAIWARCRYRLTKYLLNVPRELLLGCHMDAVYLAGDPGWAESQDPGKMRRKGITEGPLPAPATMEECRALRGHD